MKFRCSRRRGDLAIPKDYKRILIIDLAWLGDVTLSTPVIANLRINHPDSKIEFLVSRNSSPTVLNNPNLDDVKVIDRPSGPLLGQYIVIRKIASELRVKKYDIAFILHRSFGSALIAYFAKIPIRVGLNTDGREFLLTHKVELDRTQHRMDNNLRLIELMGEKITTRKPEYYPSNEIGEIPGQVESFRDGHKLVVINPNGVWETKRWRVIKFHRLADQLIAKYDARIVVIGGPGDEKRGELVQHDTEGILDLTAKTSVDDLYRICKMSDLVISNDSGPMHVAACADVPIIAIFGPTDPARCGPRNADNKIVSADADCLKCYRKTCEDMICMDRLDEETILNLASDYLQ